MPTLSPLDRIPVPPPRPDETYATRVLEREYSFHGLKRLLGAADHDKAGDRNAGLAAASEVEREAARAILAGLTLGHLYDHPVWPRNSSDLRTIWYHPSSQADPTPPREGHRVLVHDRTSHQYHGAGAEDGRERQKADVPRARTLILGFRLRMLQGFRRAGPT